MLEKGNIISLKMAGGGTGKDDSYSYYLREKDGETLFDAYYRTYCDDGEAKEVTITNVAVTQKDMDDMRHRCEKWEPAEKQDNREMPGNTKNDSTIIQIEAIWENNAKLETKMVLSVDSRDMMYLLFSFERLTRQLGGCYRPMPEEPAAEGKIVSLEFSYGGSGRNPFTAYRYHLREENGEALFDAHCRTGKNYMEITLEKAVVSREDVDALIEICGGNSILAKQQKDYAVAASSVYIVPPWREIYDRINEMQTLDGPGHKEDFTVKWENGAKLLTSPPDGKLALLNYLEMLAVRLKK